MATEDAHIRASDFERDRVIEALGRHTADGRLTLEEFGERVDEALAATSRADLEPVLRDLPGLAPDVATTARRRLRAPLPDARALVTVMAVVLAAVMVMSGAWWIVFPLIGVFGGCGRRGVCGSRRFTDDRGRSTPAASDDDRELIRV